MKRDRSHLRVLLGGRYEPPVAVQEADASARLYPLETRRVKAEPRPDPNPPKAAA